jgi:hypothetical protein
MSEQPADELPWNEARWEAFFKESDVKAAKFAELLETFIDHPDRDAIIDHEMGWDRDKPRGQWSANGAADEDAEEDEDDDSEDVDSEDDFDELDEDLDELADDLDAMLDDVLDEEINPEELFAEAGHEDVDRILSERKSSLAKNMAYARSFKFGLTVHKALKPWLRSDEPDVEIDEDLETAFGQALVIGAKLHGAHGMGTDDDVLCGNIVCCRRGLEAAQDTVRSLESLRDRGIVPADVLAPLIADGNEVRRIVEEHIAGLRSRVWWE